MHKPLMILLAAVLAPLAYIMVGQFMPSTESTSVDINVHEGRQDNTRLVSLNNYGPHTPAAIREGRAMCIFPVEKMIKRGDPLY